MNNFKELKVWQKAIRLTVEIYKLTSQFPKSETYGISSQIQRAAVSITCNISEGCGKTSEKDFNRFLEMALGSANEVENFLIICKELNYINLEDANTKSDEIQEIIRMIIGLTKTLNK